MPATPLVTVCVPAYRAAGFLPQTLASVRDQEFRDFRVRVAIEPDGAEETLEACAQFAMDDRFELVVNTAALGWPGNVRALLHEVRTPFFVVLPHDDLWHPRYLATLIERLADRPDAVTVFSDTYLFMPPIGVRTIDLGDGPMPEQLLSFFVTGAEGYPWRGLTRSQVLHADFPDNEFTGFFVECEWAAHLILSGRVLRHPEPLFMHRVRPDDDPESVTSAWRFRLDEDTLNAALARHRQSMLAIAAHAQVAETEKPLLMLAAESAVLIRSMIMSGTRFDLPEAVAARYDETAAALERDGGPVARQLLMRLLVARSRHLHSRGGDERAWAMAERAVQLRPDSALALIHLARLLLRIDRPLEALSLIGRATTASPMAVGLAELHMECSRQLTALYPLSPRST